MHLQTLNVVFYSSNWGLVKWHFVISEDDGVGPVPTEFSCGQEEGEGLKSTLVGAKNSSNGHSITDEGIHFISLW